MNRFVLCAAVVGASVVPTLAGSVGQQVVSYAQGNVAPSLADYNNLSAALGLPEADTGYYGALTPFNSNFSTTGILGIGAQGSATIRLSDPVAVNPQARIGVFSNASMMDVDPENASDPITWEFTAGGRGFAGNPPLVFGGGSAIVSVSSDGIYFVPLSVTPTVFNTPANSFLDNDINLGRGSLGSISADYFKPFNGAVSDFGGLRYRDPLGGPDILKLLDGSAGGQWLDISGVGLASVEYVRFDVPESSRMIIDAVTAIPEPIGASLLLAGLAMLRRKRA
jgi:hypothetical protein